MNISLLNGGYISCVGMKSDRWIIPVTLSSFVYCCCFLNDIIPSVFMFMEKCGNKTWNGRGGIFIFFCGIIFSLCFESIWHVHVNVLIRMTYKYTFVWLHTCIFENIRSGDSNFLFWLPIRICPFYISNLVSNPYFSEQIYVLKKRDLEQSFPARFSLFSSSRVIISLLGRQWSKSMVSLCILSLQAGHTTTIQ
jgi:hypothetical protein